MARQAKTTSPPSIPITPKARWLAREIGGGSADVAEKLEECMTELEAGNVTLLDIEGYWMNMFVAEAQKGVDKDTDLLIEITHLIRKCEETRTKHDVAVAKIFRDRFIFAIVDGLARVLTDHVDGMTARAIAEDLQAHLVAAGFDDLLQDARETVPALTSSATRDIEAMEARSDKAKRGHKAQRDY